MHPCGNAGLMELRQQDGRHDAAASLEWKTRDFAPITTLKGVDPARHCSHHHLYHAIPVYVPNTGPLQERNSMIIRSTCVGCALPIIAPDLSIEICNAAALPHSRLVLGIRVWLAGRLLLSATSEISLPRMSTTLAPGA